MGGEGSMLSMIISLNNNKALLGKRHKKDKFHSISYGTNTQLVNEKKLSPEEFKLFKEHLQKKRLKKDIITIVISTIALLITVYLFYLLIKNN